MGYNPSPRPTFNGPAHIPYQTVTRHLWGDQISGEVADWIYVSSKKIHQLVFGLPPDGAFRHSDEFRTIFGADEVLYVLSGVLVISNPSTGEVHKINKNEAVFFRKDTWHHAFNFSSEPLRILEIFAPPPSQGTSGAYAKKQPLLEKVKYCREEWIKKWPMAISEANKHLTMKVLRDNDFLWSLEGNDQQVLVGIIASTENLTTCKVQLRPGKKSEIYSHNGDKCIYLLEGVLNIHLPENDEQKWFELNPQDGFYIPKDVPHQFQNITNQTVSFIFGTAPTY